MAKKKQELTYDSAKEQLVTVKTDLKTVLNERRALLKDNKLKKTEDHSKHKDKKIAKAYKDQTTSIDALEATKKELMDFMKANKPEKGERVTKYAYPDGFDAEQRKKFRANCRAAAKRAKVSLEDYLVDPAKYDAADKEAKEKKAAEKKPAKKKEGKKDKADKAETKDEKPKKDKKDKKKKKKKDTDD